MDRTPSWDDSKYAATEFIRSRTPQSAKLLILHQQYTFESFFFRDYKMITDANITAENLDKTKDYLHYEFVVMSAENDLNLRKYFSDHGFQVVYNNPEITIMQK